MFIIYQVVYDRGYHVDLDHYGITLAPGLEACWPEGVRSYLYDQLRNHRKTIGKLWFHGILQDFPSSTLTYSY